MTASLPSTTATIRAAHLSANSSAWPAVAGRSRNASQPAKDTSDWTTIRCGSTTPGTGTSHWPCSGTPSSPFSPAAIGRKKGTRSSQPDRAHRRQRRTHHPRHPRPELPAGTAAATPHPPDPRRGSTPVRRPPPGQRPHPHRDGLVDLPSATPGRSPPAPRQATPRTPGSSPVVLAAPAPPPGVEGPQDDGLRRGGDGGADVRTGGGLGQESLRPAG